MEATNAAIAWLRSCRDGHRTGPPIRWLATGSDESHERCLKACLSAMQGNETEFAAPGTTAAVRLTNTLRIPVSAVSRLVYETTTNGRRPRTHDSIQGKTSVVVAHAEKLGRDQVGDLLATGLCVLLTTSGEPAAEGFLAGRQPDYDDREPEAPPPVTLLGTGSCRIATRRLVDGTIEIICLEDNADLGLRRQDVFAKR